MRDIQEVSGSGQENFDCNRYIGIGVDGESVTFACARRQNDSVFCVYGNYPCTQSYKCKCYLWTPDWHTNINRGTYRTSTYNGPLGTGTIYYEAIISVTHYDNQTTGYTTFNGHGNYKEIITITNGPYGKGTIEGIRVMEWDFDILRPVSTRYHLWGNATYQHATGDLEGIRMNVNIDTYQVMPNRISTYTGSIMLP